MLAGGLLVALTIPALGMNTINTGTNGLPRSLPVMQTYDRIQAAFPGGPQPALVTVQAQDVTSPAVKAGIAELEREAIASGQMSEPVDVTVNPDKTLAIVQIPMQGEGTDDASNQALATLRNDVIPTTIAAVPGVDVHTTGMTAGSKDFNDSMRSHLPLVFAFVLGLAFILLLVTFRSIVVPIKAIILNLLSVGAAYGILTLVFQHGWFEGLLGFESQGGITSWLPLFLFVILFGLSMDYHVFIISRIREAVDGGMKTERGGRPRHQVDGGRRDQRRDGHGRRVRDLRDAEHARLQDDGRRPRGRDPHRRDHRPGGPAARHDEAPGRVELVPAQGPALAAEGLGRGDRAPGPARARQGVAAPHPLPRSRARRPAGSGPLWSGAPRAGGRRARVVAAGAPISGRTP